MHPTVFRATSLVHFSLVNLDHPNTTLKEHIIAGKDHGHRTMKLTTLMHRMKHMTARGGAGCASDADSASATVSRNIDRLHEQS